MWAWRWLGLGLAALLGISALAILLLVLALNSEAGRRWVSRTVASASDGAVSIEDLTGRFPDAPSIGRLTVSDAQGPWLVLENLQLEWNPYWLLGRSIRADRLSASRVLLRRLPLSEDSASGQETDFSLPVTLEVESLVVDRLDLAEGIAGPAARSFSARGSAAFRSLERGRVELEITESGGRSQYDWRARTESGGLESHLTAHEAEEGLLASLAGLPEIGPVELSLAGQGPWNAVAAQLQLSAGPANLRMEGTVNLDAGELSVQAQASAPAMHVAESLSWQEIGLQASLSGPFRRVSAHGHFALRDLAAGGLGVRDVSLNWRGEAGRLHIEGEVVALRLPLAQPELLAAAPLTVVADTDLTAETLRASVRHPLLVAEAQLAGVDPGAWEFDVRFPQLGPLAALAGMSLRGEAALRAQVQRNEEEFGLALEGRISVPSGTGPLPVLIGDSGNLQAKLKFKPRSLDLDLIDLRGRSLRVKGAGGLRGESVDLGWSLNLEDLSALAPQLAGRLSADGQIKGPLESFAAQLAAHGELSPAGFPKGRIVIKASGSGFPSQPKGELNCDGVLAGAGLNLASRWEHVVDPTGAFRVFLDRANWKSARASGSLILAGASGIPAGNLDLRVERLEDFAPITGLPLSGRVSASLTTTGASGREQAQVLLEGRDLTLSGEVSGERLLLDVVASNPFSRPVLKGALSLNGWSLQGVASDAKLDVSGPLDGLLFGLQGKARELRGADLAVSAQGRLDLPGTSMTLDVFETDWRKENLKLLQPARLNFGDGLSVDRLRLGAHKAELDLRGRVTPALDLAGDLKGFPLALVGLVQPALDLDGQAQATARLSGPLAAPRGSLDLAVKGLRARSGPGRGLPPTQFQLTARSDGQQANLDARLAAGAGFDLGIAGLAPLNPISPVNLRGKGSLDLKMLDSFLGAGGRRARGRVVLEATLAGTFREPRMTGQASLDHGEWQDYAQGIHLLDLSGLMQAEGESLRVTRLVGRAGSGTVSAQGSLNLAGTGMPLDLKLTARKATALSNERVEVNLDADVGLSGRIEERLALTGKLAIKRAEIRIPERMPANIAVLNVREPGVPPSPPPEPGPDLAMDLSVVAPEAVFVRGRGLDAELAGKVHLGGSLQSLQPEGGFFLRRGQFSLAGQTLTFSKGVVGFDGGSITDPSLNFLAESSNGNVTAKLQVTGSAQKPKISLSSVPDLPQDEVLAQLLFGRGSASLSPFEMVQIASALASLAGLTPSTGDTLGGVRDRLGLDRLSFGSGGKGPTLEGGRYVAPGIYVGAKQGASLNSTQGMVQIDVARGLKLEASVGTGSATGSTAGTSSVGVIYQYEY